MYDMFFPKSCTVNSDFPDGQYCVLLSNEGLLPFYGYLHYFYTFSHLKRPFYIMNFLLKLYKNIL